jgi:acetyl-CoA carboxylase biotin carboxyl carrier protein
MEFKQIQELIKSINKSGISELCIEQGDFRIVIKQDHTGSAVAMPVYQPVAAAPVHQVVAPVMPVAEHSAPAATVEKPANGGAEKNYITVKSPMIGTFYRSPSPDKPSFVNVGDEIRTGQIICIIEAMKLFNEIESEVSGKIVKVFADDSSPVEYDQPLFLVDPA